MKVFSIVLSLMICFVLMVSVANAETTAVEKIKRGVFNIVTSPVEIPKQVRSYWITGSEKTPHILAWIFCGAVKGGVNMISRIGSGVWDIAASGFDVPKGGELLMKPSNVFDEWPKRTRPAKPMLE